jgi:hypothetical protein
MSKHTFHVGDTVNILNSIRLPKVEQVIGYGVIERITTSAAGTTLYWLDSRRIAVTANVLRPAMYRLPDGSVVRVDATAVKCSPVIDFTLADGTIVKAERV